MATRTDMGIKEIQDTARKIKQLRSTSNYIEADKLRDYLKQHNVRLSYDKSNEVIAAFNTPEFRMIFV